MSQDITTVFFDLGNVFFSYFTTSDPVLGDKFIGEAIRKKGGEEAYKEYHAFYTQSMGGHRGGRVMAGRKTEREHYKDVITIFGLDFTADFIMERIVFEAYKKTWGILPRLRTAGYRLGIISNHAERWSQMAIDTPSNDGTPFRDYFDADLLVFSWFYRCKKPGRKIFKRAIAVSDARPEQCLFVDDEQQNLDAAKSVGIQVVSKPYNYNVAERGRVGAETYDRNQSQLLEQKLRECGVHI